MNYTIKKKITNICLLTFVLIPPLLLISCNNSKTESNRSIKNINIDDSKNKIDYSFLDQLAVKNLPHTDSTNFDNYNFSDTLSLEKIALLNLTKINSDNNLFFSINYKVKLSPTYHTIIVSYYREVELFTVLINYDNNYKIIDFKTIAYDEIAESWLRITSKIKNNNIEITEYDYSSGEMVSKRKVYEINNRGLINEIRSQ